MLVSFVWFHLEVHMCVSSKWRSTIHRSLFHSIIIHSSSGIKTVFTWYYHWPLSDIIILYIPNHVAFATNWMDKNEVNVHLQTCLCCKLQLHNPGARRLRCLYLRMLIVVPNAGSQIGDFLVDCHASSSMSGTLFQKAMKKLWNIPDGYIWGRAAQLIN